MEITLSTGQTGFDLSDVRSALQAALSREMILARARRQAYARTCREYEEQFGMALI